MPQKIRAQHFRQGEHPLGMAYRFEHILPQPRRGLRRALTLRTRGRSLVPCTRRPRACPCGNPRSAPAQSHSRECRNRDTARWLHPRIPARTRSATRNNPPTPPSSARELRQGRDVETALAEARRNGVVESTDDSKRSQQKCHGGGGTRVTDELGGLARFLSRHFIGCPLPAIVLDFRLSADLAFQHYRQMRRRLECGQSPSRVALSYLLLLSR